jgi:alkylated DNA repair protein (DNA oxidative demethylase)
MAAEVGYPGFCPDACLINRYAPEAQMTLHQDRDEVDFGQPIVSWSLGMAAVFLFGGQTRQERPQRVVLDHGDAVVWGGPTRLVFHGIAPIKGPAHPELGACRVNLTFRRAA